MTDSTDDTVERLMFVPPDLEIEQVHDGVHYVVTGRTLTRSKVRRQQV